MRDTASKKMVKLADCSCTTILYSSAQLLRPFGGILLPLLLLLLFVLLVLGVVGRGTEERRRRCSIVFSSNSSRSRGSCEDACSSQSIVMVRAAASDGETIITAKDILPTLTLKDTGNGNDCKTNYRAINH